MEKTTDNKKRVILFAALILFAAGIFVWMVMPMLRFQVKQDPMVIHGKQNQAPADSKYAEAQSCTAIQEDQSQNNDTLFIGCNGFF